MHQRDVAVLILLQDNTILLQKRSKTAKRFPDTWGLFGGGLEQDELPEYALQREVLEELELPLHQPKLFKTYPYQLPELKEQGTVFAFVETYSGQPCVLHEGQEMKWVPFDAALDLELHPIYREIIREIVRGESGVLS